MSKSNLIGVASCIDRSLHLAGILRIEFYALADDGRVCAIHRRENLFAAGDEFMSGEGATLLQTSATVRTQLSPPPKHSWSPL